MPRLFTPLARLFLITASIILGAGFSLALFRAASAAGRSFIQPPLVWFTAGAAAYLPIHIIFRRLIIVHVFGHELTHALWSMLFGGKVREIYVSGRTGGFTTYTKGNFLVTLAPYFFPLYTLILIGLNAIVRDSYRPPILFLAGASTSFHILLTLYSIRIGQADLRAVGLITSLTFIYLMNCIVFGLLLCAISPARTPAQFLTDGISAVRKLPPVATRAASKARTWLDQQQHPPKPDPAPPKKEPKQ